MKRILRNWPLVVVALVFCSFIYSASMIGRDINFDEWFRKPASELTVLDILGMGWLVVWLPVWMFGMRK